MSTTLGSALVYLPLWWLFLPSTLSQAPVAETLMQAVYQGVLVVFVAMLLYTLAVRHLGSQTVAPLMAVVPGLSALAAVPVPGARQAPNTRQSAGRIGVRRACVPADSRKTAGASFCR